jgi:hypothetical protein
MPVTRAQAKEICTKPEYELVEASFRPAVTEMTPARLRSKIERARKLQDKNRQQAEKQNRETKDREPGRQRSANLRTERKAKLFAETRERFEKRLAEVESKGTGEGDATGAAGKSARARSSRANSENRKARRQAKRELGGEAS